MVYKRVRQGFGPQGGASPYHMCNVELALKGGLSRLHYPNGGLPVRLKHTKNIGLSSPTRCPTAMQCRWVPTRTKRLSMASTARVIWLCVCVRHWPDCGGSCSSVSLAFFVFFFYLRTKLCWVTLPLPGGHSVILIHFQCSRRTRKICPDVSRHSE